MSDFIRNTFLEASETLQEFISREENFKRIHDAGNVMAEALKAGNKIISCGNGGSMCDAMHFAEELTGKFRNDRPSIAAISISDPSHISCVANDYGYDYVFSRYVEGVGRKGDVLLAISTSGNSKNVYLAALAAKEAGMKVIGLTGKDGGKLKEVADVEIRAPQSAYADRAQEIHIKVIHALMGYIEANI